MLELKNLEAPQSNNQTHLTENKKPKITNLENPN